MKSPLLPLLSESDPKKSKDFSGLHGSALSYSLAGLLKDLQKPLLLLLPTQKEVHRLAEDLLFFLGEEGPILSFPPMGILPYFGLSPNSDAVARRMSFLHSLRQQRTPYIGLLSYSSLLRRLPPVQIFNDYSDYLVRGEEIDRDGLLKKLLAAGYQNAPIVEDPGTFSKRGGILDLYSPQSPHPVRLEFFGDQLESLRYFDAETQRSLEEIEELIVLPAREIIFGEENLAKAKLKFREKANETGLSKEERGSFLDALKHQMVPPALETYLPLFYSETTTLFSYLPKDFLGICIEPEEGKKHVEEIRQEVRLAFESCESLERVVLPDEILLQPEEIGAGRAKYFIWASRLLGEGGEVRTFQTQGHEDLTALIRHAHLGEAMLQPLMERIQSWIDQRCRIGMVAGTHAQLLRLEDLLERHQVPVKKISGGFPQFLEQSLEGKDKVFLIEGHLAKGFLWPHEKLVLVTDQEIFGEKRRRRQVGRRPAETFTTFEELSQGDYIVHEDHGLGIYRGLENLKLNGEANDFLLLEYLGGDRLYLPVYRLNLISRYAAQEGHVPRLDKMGGSNWEKSKSKVRQELKSIAGDLIKLYAERATLQGYAFSPGGSLYEEFEATFPFEETPDQFKAIQDVNRDMDEAQPMDRLVCGDVGFGKTEVAMRAAFRAVLDNKQVAVLVPTTVLALQHERNFRARLQQYPAVIETLSRFAKPKKQKEILENMKHGKVDIVIGTHALLGKKVEFKDLGLLIVDEEHRFGVAQKEKIKQLKKLSDVLTLTATPIPRTLNMSLSGIRDLSVIGTPPVDRMSIQTFVANYNEALIKEAVHRELARGGQVYFIHNRVKTIQKLRRRLGEILPEAKIEVGHGQMNEKELEEVMVRFLNREFNVFLCTTIVESGLDIPSANTMIVNRADSFGLAQLYQLRGRIGRSNVRAYAYLLTPGQENITSKARARLSVLQRYSDLGSGFKIAAHDLEIRGSGNLLGSEQSGHIAAVGYDLYMRLMEEAMAEVKGEDKRQAPEPELSLKLSATIPESYMPETTMRLALYKRFASVLDEDELEVLEEETRDRFGEIPIEIKNLLLIMRVKLLAQRAWIKGVILEEKKVVFTFDQESPVNVEHLTGMIAKEPERFYWMKPHELAMKFKAGKEEKAIESVLKFLMNLQIGGGT